METTENTNGMEVKAETKKIQNAAVLYFLQT